MDKATIKFAIISVLLGNIYGLQISAVQESNFTAYLNETIKGYSSYLILNQLDPSPPTPKPEILKIKSLPEDLVVLDCDIRDQVASGHSVATVANAEGSVSFNSYRFDVTRKLDDTIELYGDFECLGKVNSQYFPELNRTDLYFYGDGEFSVGVSSSLEYISYLNVGITENFTLDFEHSYTNYGLLVNISQQGLNGNWNVSNLSNYLPRIRNEFFDLYKISLSDGRSEENRQANPLYRLLKEYMDSKTKDLDLREILSESELPVPYKPTPTPTTTPEPTTEVTEKLSTQQSVVTSTTAASTITESTTSANTAATVPAMQSCVLYILCMCLVSLF